MPLIFLDHEIWFSYLMHVTAFVRDVLFSFLRKPEHMVMRAQCICRSCSDTEHSWTSSRDGDSWSWETGITLRFCHTDLTSCNINIVTVLKLGFTVLWLTCWTIASHHDKANQQMIHSEFSATQTAPCCLFALFSYRLVSLHRIPDLTFELCKCFLQLNFLVLVIISSTIASE